MLCAKWLRCSIWSRIWRKWLRNVSLVEGGHVIELEQTADSFQIFCETKWKYDLLLRGKKTEVSLCESSMSCLIEENSKTICLCSIFSNYKLNSFSRFEECWDKSVFRPSQWQSRKMVRTVEFRFFQGLTSMCNDSQLHQELFHLLYNGCRKRCVFSTIPRMVGLYESFMC